MCLGIWHGRNGTASRDSRWPVKCVHLEGATKWRGGPTGIGARPLGEWHVDSVQLTCFELLASLDARHFLEDGFEGHGSSVRQTFCLADLLWPESHRWLRFFLLRLSSSICDTAVTRL